MTEGDRIKELRKARGLTLEKFGERVGVGKSAISDIERGRNSVTDQMRRSICREFGVREEWLRGGEGEMEDGGETFDLNELADRMGATELERELVRAYLELDEDTRRKVMAALTQVFERSQTSTPEQRARARADEYYQEVLAEEKAAEESSATRKAADVSAKEA